MVVTSLEGEETELEVSGNTYEKCVRSMVIVSKGSGSR